MPLLTLSKFLVIFAVARIVGCTTYLVPASAEPSLRAYELGLLHKVATQGPGGFDDAVQMTLLDAPMRYAGGVAQLLRESSSGSQDEEVGLYFSEYVSADPRVARELRAVAARHTDPRTKEFIAQILADPKHAPTEP